MQTAITGQIKNFHNFGRGYIVQRSWKVSDSLQQSGLRNQHEVWRDRPLKKCVDLTIENLSCSQASIPRWEIQDFRVCTCARTQKKMLVSLDMGKTNCDEIPVILDILSNVWRGFTLVSGYMMKFFRSTTWFALFGGVVSFLPFRYLPECTRQNRLRKIFVSYIVYFIYIFCIIISLLSWITWNSTITFFLACVLGRD